MKITMFQPPTAALCAPRNAYLTTTIDLDPAAPAVRAAGALA